MTILDLVRKCANSGSGKIRIINHDNIEDNKIFNSVSELEKYQNIANREVLNWEFCPQKKLDAISWEFVLEVMV